MPDSPVAVLDRTPDTEQTTQLFLPPWQWPTRDPDEHRVIADARTALHRRDEPTLPILKAVLAGLRRLL
ncbi:hypothetical protein SAXI111661_06620 [Saccharomonospora xinjiangensis]|uniref:hypothetical protein n=1 Tax=Saccharomonospora xinjiangensis TaxID=75294 RepID=UPI00106F7AA4|nr:hypothetical protein [Saccharomonospora xinjiangensis]QBQ59495.1 hypothetical protein EYD13_05625 [Saccharomonospora xinjiangensis]